MDIVSLEQHVQNNPSAYVEEYKTQLQAYKTLIHLPAPPVKRLRALLSFLLKFPTLSTDLGSVIIDSLAVTKLHKIRKAILNNLFLLYYKKLITLQQLFKSLLDYSTEFRSILERCKLIVTGDVLPLLLKYYEDGNEKQKCFCYFLLLCLFTSGHDELVECICGGLLVDGKIGKMCLIYFLDKINFLGASYGDLYATSSRGIAPIEMLGEKGREYAKKLYRKIVEEKVDREIKVMQLKIYALLKQHYKLKATLVSLVLKMLNPEKEDVKDLMRIVVLLVSEKDVNEVINTICNEFCSEFKDDDMIVYGMNLLREIYHKFYDTDGNHQAVKFLLGEDETASDTGDEALSKDPPNEGELQSDEKTVKQNCLNSADMKTTEFITDIKLKIKDRIECFKDTKSKPVRFAYNGLKKSLNYGIRSDKDVDFVKHNISREERIESKKRGVDKKRIKKKPSKLSVGKHSLKKSRGRKFKR